MKKALLFAGLAFSMNASAQNLQSTPGMHHVSPNLMENPRAGIEDKGVNTYGIIHHQSHGQLTLVQQNDSIYIWHWDKVLGWTIAYKIIDIVYDSNNNLKSELLQWWEDTAWLNGKLRTYTYDTNDTIDNLTSVVFQSWDGSSWVNAGLITYTYDAHNNLTSELYQYWDGSTLMNDRQLIYTYDMKNNQTGELIQLWDGYAWSFYDHYTYFYDVKNNLTSELQQWWSDTAWVNNNQYTYFYDTKNNLTIKLRQYWEGSAWYLADYYTYDYDVKNNLTSELQQWWSDTAWVNYNQHTYTYDFYNNQTSESEQYWDGSAWRIYNQYTDFYDANKFLQIHTTKIFDSTGTIIPSTVGQEPYIYSDSIYYFFHTVTGIHDLRPDGGSIIVYPNPTSGIFTISSKTTISAIEIYNLLGEQVYSNSQFYQKTTNEIDLSDQGKGIYIINIYDGKLMYTRKVIIQ